MSESLLVRASRDGDQFHYIWAARRALKLLTPNSGLVAITIEGASTDELNKAQTTEAGEELIDIAEYYTSTELEKATRVRYMQLKHSTFRVDEIWQPSGLEGTITGFAKRYLALQLELPGVALHEKLEFWFVTNRPISTKFIEAVEDAAANRKTRNPKDLTKLKKFTSLNDAELETFCSMLRFESGEDGYWNLRNILSQDVTGYLPDLDVDAPMRLKELVTRKALSESATNPAITKIDVLRALQTDERDLFPAPCLIDHIDRPIPREQESELIASIIAAAGTPVIVSADAGVGKSIFSTRIGLSLPLGSVSILYDCFGNGQYRSATGYRHRHRTALVQIANELSTLALCHPLIPTTNADSSAYMRAFLHRIAQSVSLLRAKSPTAVLCIVVDAADNAQMAAEEISEPRSFIRDLLREKLPEGVCIVALCRPHRQVMLDAPPGTLSLALNPFSRDETAEHLRLSFPEATEPDVDEFHRLSSHNPRVQALALSRKIPIVEMLRLLGPNPTTVETAIGSILEKSIATLRDAEGLVDSNKVDLICAGLASLRPLIPISVLSEMSGVHEAAIKSFVLDLGRPLIVNGDTIQFFDEPAESWFREKYRPDMTSITGFVERLKGLSSSSAYVAAALPQLMLEAGQFSELVDIALSSHGLPETSPVERRDIELQRLQFALKASLRLKRYSDATKLALKAGGESAGDDRQRSLLQDNSDLATVFLDSNGVLELVSRRTFGSGWVGSHHVYEAAILSGHSELMGEARSRLRMAEEWLYNWSRLPSDESEKEPVSDEDRAVMAMAILNIHGAEAAAKSLRRWSPRVLSYSAGRILACRLLDHGRYDELDLLALAAKNDLGLIFALAVETRNLHHLLPVEAAERGLKLLLSRHIKVNDTKSTTDPVLPAIRAMIETAYLHDLCDINTAKDILDRYIPKTPHRNLTARYSGDRTQQLKAYALRAALNGTTLELKHVATLELQKELTSHKKHSESRELRELNQDIGALLPWLNTWAKAFLGKKENHAITDTITKAKSTSDKIEQTVYSEESFTSNEIANLWIDALIESNTARKDEIQKIIDWSKTIKRQLFTPTLNRLARICAQTNGSEDLAFDLAQTAFSLLREERSDAQNKVEGYVHVARSILTISRPEAQEYFNQAVEVASKIGDENLARWEALIYLAECAARTDRPAPEIAYKFSRCAEVTWDYVVRDKHFAWSATIEALIGLCPSSSIAIISRWRDRRFGRDGRVLALAIENLVARGAISPLDALPCIGFQADWNEIEITKAAILACTEKATQETALQLTYRYMTLEVQSTEKWQHLKSLSTTVGLKLPNLNEHIATSKKDCIQRAPATSNSNETTSQKTSNEWNTIFSECDLTTATGIHLSHQRYSNNENLRYTNEFFKEVFSRVQAGKECEFIKAFGTIADFDLYQLRNFLEAFPQKWKSRLSVRSTLGVLLKDFCRRFCMEIKRSRYYELMPLRLGSELSGVTESELFDVTLSAISEYSELVESDRLFSLVGLLSTKLSSEESLEVLSYGLDLFNSILEDNDGDGVWRASLIPPKTVEDSLAGYIWAGLASPVAMTRWEAAHVVVSLCAMGRTNILSKLFAHASLNTTYPFGDERFNFYSLHAQQWLMIATSRAAQDHGVTLATHLDYFMTLANLNQPHVLIRLFAARTILTLEAKGFINLPKALELQLTNINISPFVTGQNSSFPEQTPHGPGILFEEDQSDRYFFGIDFGPYWLEPLGRCFGISQSEVESEALKAIRGDLGYSQSHRWDADERNNQKIYKHDRTHHSHGSYPREDDLSFYLSYHAMLISAGRLLNSRPEATSSSDWYEDSFSDWIRRHDITRTDGRWLADRRDPQPASRMEHIEHTNNSEWLTSIAADDFEKALYATQGYICVWGRWSQHENSNSESISINTALVSTKHSIPLLRALQTTNDPHNYRIPDAEADEQFQINHDPYQMKGWIVERAMEVGIDNNDRWAGNVRFPAPEPASFVIDLMELTTDTDRRAWYGPMIKSPLFFSESWGTFTEKDSYEQPSGERLNMSIQHIPSFLKAANMDLIIKIGITRKSTNNYYARGFEHETRITPPSTRIFIIKSDGTIRTL